MPISLDLRSKNLCLSICFENGPNGKNKVFSWFSPLKIETCKCWFRVICNLYLETKIVFQQLQGGLCNEFDSSSFELKFFGGAL